MTVVVTVADVATADTLILTSVNDSQHISITGGVDVFAATLINGDVLAAAVQAATLAPYQQELKYQAAITCEAEATSPNDYDAVVGSTATTEQVTVKVDIYNTRTVNAAELAAAITNALND